MDIVSVEQLRSGNVHDTFLVTNRNSDNLILQRLNKAVFPNILHVMENLFFLSEYCIAKRAEYPDSEEFRWQFPFVVPTQTGWSFLDFQDECWRAFSYIGDSRLIEKIDSLKIANEVGRALGGFHKSVFGLDPSRLHDTLPGFHITPLYLSHYDTVIMSLSDSALQDERVAFCRRFVEKRRSVAPVLEKARALGKLALRVIHGDPKLANILFNTKGDKAIALIDLDTVKPGLILYDLGDCLRSCCNRSGGEDCDDLELVAFDPAICEAVLEGYLAVGAEIVSSADYDYLYEAIRLIPFELGLRFFTDYLEGNVYFKTYDVEQNLKRALVQFRLVESIEQQKDEICTIISELRFANSLGTASK